MRKLSGALLVIAAGASIPAAHADTIEASAEHYRPQMVKEIDQALAGARVLHDRLAANDLEGAKQAWIKARTGWESAEVFTSGFVPELDEQIDAWPNAKTGFHAIEAKLFGAGTTDVGDEANRLVYHLADLDVKIHYTPLNAQGLLNGTARLAYEVGQSKADGGESRYSGTSLDDMRNNVQGIQGAYDIIFATALAAADPKLAAKTQAAIDRLKADLAVTNLKELDTQKLRAGSEDLVVALQEAAPKLGLLKPTLEDVSQ